MGSKSLREDNQPINVRFSFICNYMNHYEHFEVQELHEVHRFHIKMLCLFSFNTVINMEIFQRMFIITNLRCILKKLLFLLFYINNIFYQAERGKAYGISLILNSKNTIHMLII